MNSERIDTPSPILIIGCGDIGRRVAALWAPHGGRIVALSHSDDNRQRLQSLGLEAVAGDLDQPLSLAPLQGDYPLVYYFAPPPATGIGDPRLNALLARLGQVGRLIYISTSGVYGDCNGVIVNEDQPPRPSTERSQRRLAAEQALQQWAADRSSELIVLRVGGIYGPGRLPYRRLEQGLPVLAPEQAPYSNRIHADDLANICYQFGQRGRAGIYNVCDGHNSSMSDYFLSVARMAGLPQPPLVDWEEAERTLSPEMMSYLTESRRLDISKLRAELDYRFIHPDLQHGLHASLVADGRLPE